MNDLTERLRICAADLKRNRVGDYQAMYEAVQTLEKLQEALVALELENKRLREELLNGETGTAVLSADAHYVGWS